MDRHLRKSCATRAAPHAERRRLPGPGPRLRWLVSVAAFLGAGGPVAGQIQGRVVDGAGHPVVAALVELRGPDTVLARTETAADGSFDLAPVPSATHVRASRFGFEPGEASLADLLHPLEVVLQPRAFELTGLRVTASSLVCPDVGKSEVRDELHSVLEASNPVRDGEEWSGPLTELRMGRGPVGGDVPLRAVSFAYASRATGDVSLRLWMDRMDQGVFLARRRWSRDREGRGHAWRFFGFHGSAAPALATPDLFRNARVVRGSRAGEYVACVEQADGVQMVARFLATEGTVAHVTWRIRTPEPVETMGGELEMMGGASLLPRRSYVWVRDSEGMMQHEEAVFLVWFVGTRERVRRAIRHRGVGTPGDVSGDRSSAGRGRMDRESGAAPPSVAPARPPGSRVPPHTP